MLKKKWPWFAADVIEDAIPVQDTVHLGAKLRVRLLKRERGIFLALGNKIASCSDLEMLLRTVSKDQHLLKDGDLNQHDKMSYDAVERLCSPKIQELLQKHVPGDKELRSCLQSREYTYYFYIFRIRRDMLLLKAHDVCYLKLSR